MALMDLLNETQQLFVSDPDMGTGESIIYTHKASGLVEETYAFASRRINHKDGDVRQDEIEFANVHLVEVPAVDDSILYQEELWKVSDDIVPSSGLYIIPALKKQRHNGRPRRRSN